MIFDRKPETEKLIAILGALEIGQCATTKSMAISLGLPNKNIASYVASARRYLEKNEKIVFGAIRGVGLQRMSPDEIAQGGLKIVDHLTRQARKGAARNRIVADRGDLSAEALYTTKATSAIFAMLQTETKNVRTKIKIATIDGREVLGNIVAAQKKTPA